MVFLSIYGILYIIGKLWISSFKWDTKLSINSVHSPFIHYLLYNICTQISRLLSIQLPLCKSMRCTRELLLSAYHSHTLPWMRYYNKNHVGAVRVVSASRLDRCYPNPELRSQISDSDHSIRSPSNLLPLSYSYCSLDPTSPFNHLFLRLFL